MSATFLKCPKCDEGYAGHDCTGEAMDCHYCDGTGRITAAMFCEQSERMCALVGDAMVADAIRREGSEPIDEGWLREIGFSGRCASWGVWSLAIDNDFSIEMDQWPPTGEWRVFAVRADLFDPTQKISVKLGVAPFTTRAQLLDLLAALGQGVQG